MANRRFVIARRQRRRSNLDQEDCFGSLAITGLHQLNATASASDFIRWFGLVLSDYAKPGSRSLCLCSLVFFAAIHFFCL